MSTELAYQVIRFAVDKLKTGDLNAVSDLGFEPDEIRAMEQMTVGELHHLARMGTHFLDVAVDHRCLNHALTHARDEARTECTQDDLIRQGAGTEMLHALCGLTPGEVCRRRRMLGVQRPQGRPPRLPPTKEDRIWRLWQAHADLDEPERYLQVARDCDVSAQAVWRLVQESRAIQAASGNGAGPPDVVPLVTHHAAQEE